MLKIWHRLLPCFGTQSQSFQDRSWGRVAQAEPGRLPELMNTNLRVQGTKSARVYMFFLFVSGEKINPVPVTWSEVEIVQSYKVESFI